MALISVLIALINNMIGFYVDGLYADGWLQAEVESVLLARLSAGLRHSRKLRPDALQREDHDGGGDVSARAFSS